MINKDRIRQKLANIANRGQPTSYWSPPKEGKANIRMFPCPHSEDPILDYFFHFGVGRQSILCPVRNGLASQCPICDLAASLYNSSNEQDKEISKRLYARQRFYATIVDRADETMTAKYWGFSMGLYQKFLGWLAEEGGDYENFMDAENGRDLIVSLEKTPGKMFAAAEAQPRARETPLAASQKDVEAILKSVKPPSEIFQVLTAAEIQARLDAWLNSEGAPDEQSVKEDAGAGTVKAGAKKEEEPKKAKRPSRNVDDLFDEMAEQL